LARELLLGSDYSFVVVKNGKLLTGKRGDGVKPILYAIEEVGNDMQGSTVGYRTLGKASALLCAYAKVAGVYAPQATKKAIAVLIRANIPGRADEMIPYVKNKEGTGVSPFETMLIDVDSPEEAYKILKNKI
jgi:hypothetical protein